MAILESPHNYIALTIVALGLLAEPCEERLAGRGKRVSMMVSSTADCLKR